LLFNPDTNKILRPFNVAFLTLFLLTTSDDTFIDKSFEAFVDKSSGKLFDKSFGEFIDKSFGTFIDTQVDGYGLRIRS